MKISENIYWVGAIDWDLRSCGSYNTPRGTTYNAYLIVDEKVALIDSVKNGFGHELLERVEQIISPEKIDYVICQHSEADHAGAMSGLMRAAKNAKVISTSAAKQSMKLHYGNDWDAQVVKTGDQLSLGSKTLQFIEAQMLHWPDNMFTYIKEDQILFSNDAFGQHIATSQRYEKQLGDIVMEEAAKYYAVIVSPYRSMVQKKLQEVKTLNIPIKIIAPAHGLIWTEPKKILEAYEHWSNAESEPRATIIYDTMWGSTKKMAYEIARGLKEEDIEVSVYHLRGSDMSVIMKDILKSAVIAVGTPTLNMGMYPSVGGFLTFLKGLKLVNKKAVAFGSYGWAKAGVKAVEEELEKMSYQVIAGPQFQYVPTEEQLKECFELGKELAKQVKEK